MQSHNNSQDVFNILDLLCISIYKIYDMAKCGNYQGNIATKEASKMVNNITKLVSLRSRPSESSSSLLESHKAIEKASISARKHILQVIGETKKYILQPDKLDSIMNCVNSTIETFSILYKNIWCIQKNGETVTEWNYSTRYLLLRLKTLLEFIEENNNENVNMIKYILNDISKSIEEIQNNEQFLDCFPVPLQALFMECKSTLTELYNNFDEKSISDRLKTDICPLIDLLSETLISETNIYLENTKENNTTKQEHTETSIKQDNHNDTSPVVEDHSFKPSIEIQTTNSDEITEDNTSKDKKHGKETRKLASSSPQRDTSPSTPNNRNRRKKLGDGLSSSSPGKQRANFGRQRSTGVAPAPPTFIRGNTENKRSQTASIHNSEEKPSNRSNSFNTLTPRPQGDRKPGIFGVQRVSSEESKKKKEKEDEKALKIISLFNDQIEGFSSIWEKLSDQDKNPFLHNLFEKMQDLTSSADILQLPNNSTKSEELEHIIRVRCASDMTKICNIEKIFTKTEKPIAENCLHVIVNSSLLVIDPLNIEYQDILLISTSNLFLMMRDTILKLPNFSIDLIVQIQDDLRNLLQDQSKNVNNLFVCDNHIVNAANGHGNKLIGYQMKINIWNHCNSFRILVATLLCLLKSCTISSQLTSSLLFQIFTCMRCIIRSVSALLTQVATTKEVITKVFQNQLDPQRNTISMGTKNIWKETSVSSGKFIWEDEHCGDVQTGSLNLLVQSLTSDINLNQTFLKTFITTYRSFTTPWQLLSKLIERYNVPLDVFSDTKRASQIQLRVAVVVKYWLDTQFYDFDEDLIQSLQEFCDKMNKDGLTDMAKRLQEHIISKVCN